MVLLSFPNHQCTHLLPVNSCSNSDTEVKGLYIHIYIAYVYIDIWLGYVYCISSLSNLNLLIKEIKIKIHIWRVYIYTAIFWPPDVKGGLTGKDPDAGKDWGQKKKEVAEDELLRKPHQITVHDSKQTLGGGAGQRSPACCSLWVAKSRAWLSSLTATRKKGLKISRAWGRATDLMSWAL